MLIIGCDFHSRFQQIAMVDTETGELIERRLEHGNGEAKKFYAELQKPVRVGMEATGYAQWFERMLTRLGHELWVGNAGEIRAAMVRKQKTDSRDALHILNLLLQGRFPRIWIPSPAERDLRQLLRHRRPGKERRNKTAHECKKSSAGTCRGARSRFYVCTRLPMYEYG